MAKTKRISRTTATNLIKNSNGKFFTVTFKTVGKGNFRTINCNMKKSAVTALGDLTVYSMQDKDYRTVRPANITALTIEKQSYIVR